MDGDRGSGAALRRRERRLRAWQGHVLAAVQLVHKVEPRNAPRGQEKRAGREEAGPETHFGSRHRRPYLRGCGRHLCLRWQQRCDRTVHGTSLGAPSVALPQLAARRNSGLHCSFLPPEPYLGAKEDEGGGGEEEERGGAAKNTIFSQGLEAASPVCWPSPPPALRRGTRLHRVQRRGRVRPCSVGWLPVRLVGGVLRPRARP